MPFLCGLRACSEQTKDLAIFICRLLRRAASIITGNFDFNNTRGADLMMGLGLQTPDIRRDYFLSTLMYDCIKGNAPVRLTNELIRTFLGTRLDIKGLHYGLACYPISKMSRMLIISSASIRSSYSNDHMSGITNICMFQKPIVVPIYSGLYHILVLLEEFYDDLCVLLDT